MKQSWSESDTADKSSDNRSDEMSSGQTEGQENDHQADTTIRVSNTVWAAENQIVLIKTEREKDHHQDGKRGAGITQGIWIEKKQIMRC